MKRQNYPLLIALLVIPHLTFAQHPASKTDEKSLAAAAQEAKISMVISEAERHLQRGKAAYEKAAFDAARVEFDLAVDTILGSRLDLRSHERLRDYFLNLIETITKLEQQALAKGHALGEQPIDIRLSQESVNVSPGDEERSQTLEAGSLPPALDFEFDITPEVAHYINYFTNTNRGRKTMANGLTRAGRYLPLVQKIFRQERVPIDLVWHAQAESNWRPQARSHAAAVGLFQFVSWRGRQYGLRLSRWIDERSSFDRSARASARYLRFLYDRFLNWELALAAYNCGENRVDRAIAASGYADFWYFRKHKLLPRETRNHVPIVLAIIAIARNPEKHGFGDIESAPPLQFDTVAVNSRIDLRLVAEITNTPYEVIEELNPELKRGVTPPDMDYDLRLPAGEGEELAALLDRIPEEHRDTWRVIRVKANDSLQTIAQHNEIGVDQIAQINDLAVDAPVEKDMALILPLSVSRSPLRGRVDYYSSRRLTVTVRRGDTLSGIAARYGTSSREIARLNHMSLRSRLRIGQKLSLDVPVRSSLRYTSESRPSSYRVRPGDALYTIAQRYGISVSDLRRWNGLRSNKIFPGQRLKVSPGEKPSTSRAKPGGNSSPSSAKVDGETYTVRRGDTLSIIAGKHRTSVSNLKQWNNLRSNKIYPGQRLVVKPRRTSKTTTQSGRKRVHLVRRGETLSGIARRYRVSVSSLRQWNGLRSSTIVAGQKLLLSRPKATSSSGGRRIRYRVRSGDTLWSIAQRFGVTVARLKAWNQLRSNRIQVGQPLAIYR